MPRLELKDTIGTRCLIGLSYFDRHGKLLRQSQLAGEVVDADEETGISIRLQHSPEVAESAEQKPSIFILPPALNCWFHAPGGHYRNPETGVDMRNPDYLVTWDIHQTQKDTPEGEHEWWEWVPRTVPPEVGNPDHS